jgi:hypothetical protein
MKLLIARVSGTLVIAALLPSGALAQPTRTAQLEGQRAERARSAPPAPKTFLDKIVLLVEDKWPQPKALAPEGTFYPRVGTVTVESGLAFGGGYRRSFANDTLRADAYGQLATRGYGVGRASLSLPRLAAHTLELQGVARYRRFPQEDYYGLGPLAQRSHRTNYLIEETDVSMQLAWRPRPWLLIASQIAWLQPRVAGGTDGDVASIETRFTEATAPGLTIPTTFFEQGALALVDYRDSPSHSHSGGRYAVYVSHYDDRHDRGFDFARVTAHVEQYVPVFDAKRVVAFRFAVNHAGAANGSRVPFYYTPTFGGGDSMRSLDDLRFRDASSWILTLEYRWEAITGVDLAVYHDRGGMAPRFESLSLADADDCVGLAVRLTTGRVIFARAEVSFLGREGVRGLIGFSAPLKLERFLR